MTLDIHTFEWTAIEKGSVSWPANRNNHATSSFRSKLQVHGGHDSVHWLDDLWIFDTESQFWIKPTVFGTPPTQRACHSLTRVGNTVQMFGGFDGTVSFNTTHALCPLKFQWTLLCPKGTVPHERSSHYAVPWKQSILLVGGNHDAHKLVDLHVLELNTMEWREIKARGNVPGVRGFTASLVEDKIIMFGGYDGIKRKNDTQELDLETQEWKALFVDDKNEKPSGRQRHASVQINGKMFVQGGFDGDKWLKDIWIMDVHKLNLMEFHRVSPNIHMDQQGKMLNNELFSDILFEFKDMSGELGEKGTEAKKIYAHKCILCAHSEHFHSMFSLGFKESEQTNILIEDCR